METPDEVTRADREAAARVFPGDLSGELLKVCGKLGGSKWKLAERGIKPAEIQASQYLLRAAAEREKAAQKALLRALENLRDARKLSLRAMQDASNLLKTAVDNGGSDGQHNTEG